MKESNATILPIMRVEDWRAPIKEYLVIGTLPSDRMEAIKLTKRALGYCLIGEVLYRRSTSSSLLKCLSSEEGAYILREMCCYSILDPMCWR